MPELTEQANVAYNAVEFWGQFGEELKEAAINLLQVVPTPTYPTQMLQQMLLQWVQNQLPTSPPSNYICSDVFPPLTEIFSSISTKISCSESGILCVQFSQ
jgi:hypothetical protein